MSRPLLIELFAGMFGWGRAFVDEGYRSVGFDILHEPYHGAVPEGCSLVLQDVLTLHGSQFRNASVIVASPPCQKYSYMAMPWKRSKAMAADIRADASGEKLRELNALFNACFRIQREASEAAGRYIPMVVENVKGAQPWVGQAKAHFGSFYLWGDVESVGGAIIAGGLRFGDLLRARRSVRKLPAHINESIRQGRSPARSTNPAEHYFGRKVAAAHREENGGTKQGGDWFGPGEDCSISRMCSSKSPARKAASAAIAKIPYDLARYIARAYAEGAC